MFCSKNCKQEHEKLSSNKEIIHSYRTSARQISSLEILYRQLAEKDKFCVICGKEVKQEKEKFTNKMASIVFMFATIVPGSLIAISSKPDLPVLTSLLK